MPWITTESGKHINTDWFDKDKQIAASKAEADQRTLEEKYIHINPNYKQDAKLYDPYGNNCVKCALAFEANMRGADVEAQGRNYTDLDENNMVKNEHSVAKMLGKKDDVWDVGSNKRELVIKRINDQMEDFGPNSRALLFLNHKNGHHVVNILANNGNPIIVDAQSGKHGDLKSMLKYYNTNVARVIQVDDATLSDDLKKWAYKRR